MSEDRIKKNIDSLRDERNHIWTLFLLTLGGSMALILQADSIVKIVIATIEILSSGILFLFYLNKSEQVKTLIRKIKE